MLESPDERGRGDRFGGGAPAQVWDEHADPFSNVVRMTIMTLRRKLGEPPVIETVIGVGYRMA